MTKIGVGGWGELKNNKDKKWKKERFEAKIRNRRGVKGKKKGKRNGRDCKRLRRREKKIRKGKEKGMIVKG